MRKRHFTEIRRKTGSCPTGTQKKMQISRVGSRRTSPEIKRSYGSEVGRDSFPRACAGLRGKPQKQAGRFHAQVSMDTRRTNGDNSLGATTLWHVLHICGCSPAFSAHSQAAKSHGCLACICSYNSLVTGRAWAG